MGKEETVPTIVENFEVEEEVQKLKKELKKKKKKNQKRAWSRGRKLKIWQKKKKNHQKIGRQQDAESRFRGATTNNNAAEPEELESTCRVDKAAMKVGSSST